MLKMKTMDEIQHLPFPALHDHIERKALELMDDYAVQDLESIGCFVVLDAEESSLFRMEEMEFMEVLLLDNETYLHGVRVLSDGFGEDVFLAMERVSRWQS